MNAFTQTELVEQFHSTAIDGKTTAKKTTRFATLPKYLLLQLKKFTLNADWTPAKLDVSVDIPDELDLSALRGHGLQPGEKPLPELTADVPAPPMDPQVLASLAEMGFNAESCKRAVFFTKNTGVEPATQWLFEHMADADFTDPFVPPGTKPPAARAADAFVANAQSVEQLVAMGFPETQVRLALKETANDVERAAEYIFTNQAQLEILEACSIGVDEQPMQQDEPTAAPLFDNKAGSECFCWFGTLVQCVAMF